VGIKVTTGCGDKCGSKCGVKDNSDCGSRGDNETQRQRRRRDVAAKTTEECGSKAAGIENLHLHQTRHTYARIVAEETGSFVETQEALDHENAATTRVYVQRITVKTDKHGDKIAKRLKLTPPN